MPLLYSLGLLLLFLLCLVGEFFVPSGGMLGVAALVAGVTAIIIAFTHSSTAGLGMTLVIVAATPTILLSMVRLWPHTPIGRRMLNRRPGQLTPARTRTMADGSAMSDLVGKLGVAKTDLLPSGLVLVADRRMDAVSIGMPINAGSAVVVIKVHGGRIQVRAAAEEEVSAAENATTSTPTGTLKSFDLESLE